MVGAESTRLLLTRYSLVHVALGFYAYCGPS